MRECQIRAVYNYFCRETVFSLDKSAGYMVFYALLIRVNEF